MRIATADTDRTAHSRVAHPSARPAEIVPLALDDEEIARRREATLRRMLATPHMPHGALNAVRNTTPGKS